MVPPPELAPPGNQVSGSKGAGVIAIDGPETQSLRSGSFDLHGPGFNLRGSAMLHERAKPRLHAYY
jgi:hypothetical protein